MADEANAQAVEQAAPVENPTADSATENQTEEQTSQSEGQDVKSEGQEQSDQDSSSASSSDNEQSKNQDSKQDSKPLSRRSAAYRIQQLVEENKTLKQQIAKPKDPDEWSEEPRADERPVAEIVRQEIQKVLNPITTASSKAADDAELSELFSGNGADRTKYEGQIRSLWNLPQYKDVAAVDLLNMLRGKEMDQVLSKAREQAVEDYKKAQKEAKESSASGTSNTNRSGKSGKSVADMSPKELEEHNQRVIAGRA